MIRTTILLTLALIGLPGLADEARLDHFEGEPSPSLEAAIANLEKYNRELSATLEADSLTAKELHAIHQLTYTLENALQRIRDDVAEIAETLETVHLSSEHGDGDTVRREAKRYLEATAPLIGSP